MTSVTNLIDLAEIEEELVVFLRNSDIFTTTQRGVTTRTDEFNGDGNTKTFTLTQTPVRNVRSVTVGGTAKSLGTEYSVNYSTAVVTFVDAPDVGVNNVDVQYDYGSTDKIYSDFPRVDLGIDSYPRIAAVITSAKTDELGVGADSNMTDFLITITTYDKKNTLVKDYIKAIRNKILINKKTFYYLKLLTPVAVNPMINEPARGDKILQQSLDCRAPFNVELIS